MHDAKIEGMLIDCVEMCHAMQATLNEVLRRIEDLLGGDDDARTEQG